MLKLNTAIFGAVSAIVIAASAPAMSQETLHMIRCGNDSGGGTAGQNQAISEWEKANSGFTVEVEYVPWGQCESKAMTLAAAGDAPAIAYIGSRNLPQLVQNGMIRPIEFSYDEMSGYSNQVLNTVIIDGKFWGVPRAFSSKALYYNKDLFEQAGLDPNTPPSTWEELLADAKAITEKTDAAGIGLVAASFNNTMHQFLNYVYSNGGSVYDEKGNVTFNSPNNVQAMQLMEDLLPYAEPGPVAYDRTKLRPLFHEGQIAMLISGPWERPRMPEGLNWATALVPHGPMGESGTILISDSLVAFEGSGVEEQAISLIKYITNPDNQFEYDMGQGATPVRFKYRTEGLLAEDPNWANFFLAVRNGGPEPLVTDFIAMQDAINGAVQSVVLGEATPEAAIATAAEALSAIE